MAVMTGLAPENLSVLEFGVASKTAPGEGRCGDLHLVVPTSRGWLLGVVDGLGHGEEAAAAAHAAVKVLSSHPDGTLLYLVRKSHDHLKGTRGAVMTLLALDGEERTITSLGIGNIEGLILNSDPPGTVQSVALRPGVIGYRLPALRSDVQPLSPGDLLILFTDGIRNDFARQIAADAPCAEIADQISRDYCRGTDDALVLVARYHGRQTDPNADK